MKFIINSIDIEIKQQGLSNLIMTENHISKNKFFGFSSF